MLRKIKKLKFSKNLIPLILSGQKTTTWRFFDDKNLQVGDELSLMDAETGKEFAKAKIVEVYEKKFKDISENDLDGHEKYENRNEMLKTYQGYYENKVDWETMVKVIEYELIGEKMPYKIVSVDFQKEFTSPEGNFYKLRPSVDFVKNTLIPFLKEKGVKIAEINSDYRGAKFKSGKPSCIPGTEGYESEIPQDIKNPNIWLKCKNSPLWTFENIGDKNNTPGKPKQDPVGLSMWIKQAIGKSEDGPVILIGLTLDVCVLCMAQELYFRGYDVRVLEEATDTYTGDQGEKNYLLAHFLVWAKPIGWEEFRKSY